MKKVFTLCLCVITALSAMAAKDGLAHWSIGVKGGIDYYRLPEGYIDGYIKNASWVVGGDVIYDVNPYFGLGVNLDYSAFNRNAVHGGVAEGDIFTTINMTNILAPNRQNNWKKFNFYADLGMGCADGLNRYSDESGNSHYKWYGAWTPYTRIKLGAEVSACKWLGVFFDANYKLYWRRWAGGMLTHEYMFSDAIDAQVGLRFRLGSMSKDHIRNTMPERATVAQVDNGCCQEIATLKAELAHMKEAQDSANDALADQVAQQVEAVKAVQAEQAEQAAQVEEQKKVNDNVQKQLSDLQSRLGIAAQNGGSITLEGVTFAFNSAELTNDSRKILDEVATTLESIEGLKKVYVNGYTDNSGPDWLNIQLSQARAESVKNYLVKKGLPASKFVAKGYGPANPCAPNTTREGRMQNRRVELSFER